MRYSKFQIETMAAVLYGVGAFAPTLLSLLDKSPYAFYLLCFTIPMFFIGFILFVIIDWGLKRLLYKPSPLAPLAILIALSIPFIPGLFTLYSLTNWLWTFALSGAMLLWSIFVVGLQYWLKPPRKGRKSVAPIDSQIPESEISLFHVKYPQDNDEDYFNA